MQLKRGTRKTWKVSEISFVSSSPDGYIILDDVPEAKCPRCCFCRRPRFVLLHLLQDTAGITPQRLAFPLRLKVQKCLFQCTLQQTCIVIIVRLKVPCETHHHGNNDGNLYGSNDGSYEDIMKLLAARNDVQNIKIQQLITLRTPIRGLTPSTRRNTHIQIHFT